MLLFKHYKKPKQNYYASDIREYDYRFGIGSTE